MGPLLSTGKPWVDVYLGSPGPTPILLSRKLLASVSRHEPVELLFAAAPSSSTGCRAGLGLPGSPVPGCFQGQPHHVGAFGSSLLGREVICTFCFVLLCFSGFVVLCCVSRHIPSWNFPLFYQIHFVNTYCFEFWMIWSIFLNIQFLNSVWMTLFFGNKIFK